MQMLWARVVSDAVRCVCPQANQGSYAPEEVEDFGDDSRGNVTTSNEPVVIDASEACKRAKVIEADLSYPDTGEVDFNICPIGGADACGKRWENMPNEWLKFALDANSPDITDGHKNIIETIIKERS